MDVCILSFWVENSTLFWKDLQMMKYQRGDDSCLFSTELRYWPGVIPSFFLKRVQNVLSLVNPVRTETSFTGMSGDLRRNFAALILVLIRYWCGVKPVSEAKSLRK